MNKTLIQLKGALIVILLISTSIVKAQSDLPKAWQAFYENKRTDARTLFTQASKQGSTAGEAYLGLSLLAQMDRSGAESFDNFKKFCDLSKNPQPYMYALWTTSSVNETFGKKSPE